MINRQEFAKLHALQTSLAVKRDWIAVAHLQALIDHLAQNHFGPDREMQSPEIYDQVH